VKSTEVSELKTCLADRLLLIIDTSTVTGLRDRAIIALLLTGIPSIEGVLETKVGDYQHYRGTWLLGLWGPDGNWKPMVVSDRLQLFIEEYLLVAKHRDDGEAPIFPTLGSRTLHKMTISGIRRMARDRIGDLILNLVSDKPGESRISRRDLRMRMGSTLNSILTSQQ
jgi:hypothetical protein